jgi:hypothetical protein
MAILPITMNNNGEKIDTSLPHGSGDAIIDIDSRTTTLVSKEPDRMLNFRSTALGCLADHAAPSLSAAEIEHEITNTITIPCEPKRG